MLQKVVSRQRSPFLTNHRASLSWTSSFASVIERHLSGLIQKSRIYKSSVNFVEGTNVMEATVISLRDSTVAGRLVLNGILHVRPDCYSYSTYNDGFSCWHVVAVICEKDGPVNLHRCLVHHLSETWGAQYTGVILNIPTQLDIHDVFMRPLETVSKKAMLKIPVADPSLRGRPPKHESKRRRFWYERGPNSKYKRTWNCSLCSLGTNTAKSYELPQESDNNPSWIPSQVPWDLNVWKAA